MRFRDKIFRFMQGRYGLTGAGDGLTRFLSYVVLFLFVLSLFRVPYTQYVAIAVIGYMYFRLMSRNVYKRSAENNWFMQKTFKIRMKLNSLRFRLLKWWKNLKTLRTHHIYKCPTCRQKIRIPRGKGKIEIRCPKCGQKFIRKS